MDALQERIARSVTLGVGALVGMQQPNGRFIYRTGSRIPRNDKKYNILRHAGSVFSLLECGTYAPQSITGAVTSALRWVEQDHLRQLTVAGTALLAVASDDDGRGEYDLCKLGGTALFLLAALRAAEAGIDIYPRDTLRQLGSFLVAMQRRDGGFHSKYRRRTGEIDPSFESLYYPGEAALALLHLHRLDPQGPWLQAAEWALLFLADKRRDQKTVEADHWALIATAHYFRLKGFNDDDVGSRISAHARQIVRGMVTEFRAVAGRETRGCFTHDGRTCPTATRLEGLIAIAPHLAEAHRTGDGRAFGSEAVDLPIRKGAAFLLEAQLTEGDRVGAFPRSSAAWLAANHGEEARRADEVRIDYIQHAICALKGVDERLQPRPAD